jgi:hypothetical protein
VFDFFVTFCIRRSGVEVISFYRVELIFFRHFFVVYFYSLLKE